MIKAGGPVVGGPVRGRHRSSPARTRPPGIATLSSGQTERCEGANRVAINLGDALGRVLDEYASEWASHPNKAGSALPAFISGDLADLVRQDVRRAGYDRKVKGSAGQGANWAFTPWVAAFDEEITSSAQRGFYVVFLLRRDGTALHLTLGQGSTEVQQTFGRDYLQVLRSRANEAWRLLKADGAPAPDHRAGVVDLGGGSALTRGYEAGAIAHRTYRRADLLSSPSRLHEDLAAMLALYRRLADLWLHRGLIAADEEAPEGIESGKYRLHRSPERNRALARKVKQARGFDCEVCGVNFAKRYPGIGDGYIEAHHLTPISSLKGRPTNLDVNDFVVVCPNCHRMLHQANPPLAPVKLKGKLGPLV